MIAAMDPAASWAFLIAVGVFAVLAVVELCRPRRPAPPEQPAEQPVRQVSCCGSAFAGDDALEAWRRHVRDASAGTAHMFRFQWADGSESGLRWAVRLEDYER